MLTTIKAYAFSGATVSGELYVEVCCCAFELQAPSSVPSNNGVRAPGSGAMLCALQLRHNASEHTMLLFASR